MIVIKTLLNRELMILKYQWLKILSFLMIFPMLIFLCVVMPLYEIISLPVMNYLHWSVPGILTICSSMICFNYGVKNIFLLKDKNKHYQIFLKSPMSINELILSFYCISVQYGLLQFFVGSILLNLINQGVFSFYQFLLITIQILSFLLFVGSLSIVVGFILSTYDSMQYVNIALFLIISFIFGALLPIELFPEELSMYLKNIPMVIVVMNMQAILLMSTPFYFGVLICLVFAVVLFLVSLVFANKKLRI
ncbi:MAG: hypothetical protein CMG07_01115 [Candidatus Marinimicrobia bacterium]|nr:hypothetical protein [Candidatus Neomarinimicrobiota bacterium]